MSELNTKIALLIVYNHRFDRNIAVLNRIYKDRFTYVYHIIPFYDGIEKNVIPVYESSYYFEGYISQAYTHLKGEGFSHFFVVADDMIINPEINENNFFHKTGINICSCYMDEIRSLQSIDFYWRNGWAMDYDPELKGVEITNILPQKQEAKDRLKKFGIEHGPIQLKSFLTSRSFINKFRYLFSNRTPRYPIVGGYSDIFLVTADVMPIFSNYCGAFAASQLFVEMAIPTAMLLSSDNIQLKESIKLKPLAMWTEKDTEFLNQYNHSYNELILNFPKDVFYMHPIKLSKWK